MTTIDSRKDQRRFFSIYKQGQGKYVRWGTVVGLGLVTLSGAYWLAGMQLAASEAWVRALAGALWIGAFGFLTFYLVNKPNLAEFMIMTESEMRKVSWPSRREVIASTKVVILLTVLLGFLLWIVDVGFYKLFEVIKIL